MIGFTTLINAVNETLDTGRRIDVRVKATSPSSFAVDIEVIASTLEHIRNLFAANDPRAVVIELLFSVGGVLQIAKSLKGKKGKVEEDASRSTFTKQSAEQGNNLSIVDSDGNSLTVDARCYTSMSIILTHKLA